MAASDVPTRVLPADGMDTNLQGRLRNTTLLPSNGMAPLYEAVSNSIHAIEDAAPSAGRIRIQITRDTQLPMAFEATDGSSGPKATRDITGFKIIDNGIGFNDANMDSFRTLDSEYKADRGGRGVGRLLWLKAFHSVHIDSAFFAASGTLTRRSFKFDAHHGISERTTVAASDSTRCTQVDLIGFSKRYRKASPKTARVIATNLLEHCLWYFVRPGTAPAIELVDGDDTVSLDELYREHMVSRASTESITLKDTPFELIHVKLSASSTRTHGIAFCAARRLVTRDNIKGKIPGLFGSLHDKAGAFVYECYVSSPLLDARVRSERTSFDIEKEPFPLFADTELTEKDIRDAVLERAETFLLTYLEEKRRHGEERVSTFVAQKAPRYRPILSRIPKEQLAVDPDIKDKDLELFLHGHFAAIESKLIADGQRVMDPKDDETYADYQKRIDEYLDIAKDIKKSDLANYVAHRRVILDILEKALQRRSDGKYEREDLIHNLIMPMGRTSEEVRFDRCNLWLIDERLAFHDYLASDKTLASMPITNATGTKEPDIISLSVFDNPSLFSDTLKLPLASIVIVELKRPMRNDAASGKDKNPVEQALDYLERVRSGKVQTQAGRQIPESENIPAFCYAICDITPTVKRQCNILGLTPTHDHLGYFGYNPYYRAYLEVVSFDRLVNAAKERNKAFFDKLGLPS